MNSQNESQENVDLIVQKKSDDQIFKNTLKPDKHQKIECHKWLFLAGACLLTMGTYYQYNIMIVLRKEIKNQYQIKDTPYNLLFTIPALVNIVLAWLFGLLNDKIGAQVTSIIYVIIGILGMVVFQISQTYNNYAGTMASSILSYIGLEAISTSQNTITAQQFIGSNMTFALGINMLFIRIDEIISSNTIPYFYNIHDSLTLPILVSIGMFFISLIAAIGIFVYIKKQDKLQKKIEINIQEDINNQEKLLDQNQQITNNKIKKVITLKDIKHLSLNYWILNLITMMGYSCFYPFMQKFEEIVEDKFNIDNDQSGSIQSITYFIAMLSPLLGLIIDKYGKRVYFLAMTFILYILAFLIFAFLPNCEKQCLWAPIPSTILLGFGLMMLSGTCWASFPLLVEVDFMSTAYGLASSIKGIGLALVPLSVGLVSDNLGVNEGVIVEMLIFSIIGLLLCILLYFLDKNTNNSILNKYTKNNIIQTRTSNINENT